MPFSTPSPPTPPATPAQRLLSLARRRLGWLALAVTLLGLVGALTANRSLWRADRLLQESALNLVRPQASDDILIVAIDKKSLAGIGRWPWRRALHAEVLRRVALGGPRCVGLDLLFSGPDGTLPADDTLLARRIHDTGCLVLPMALQVGGADDQTQRELLPPPPLAAAATGLGHVHLSLDADGVVRGVFLREGFPGREWPSFALALAQAGAGQPVTPQPPLSAAGGAMSPPAGRWARRAHDAVVFNAPQSTYRTVSYIDVLQGKVSPEVFRGRYVLIGATDTALADVFASAAPEQYGLVPGVEIFANELQDLIEGVRIAPASVGQNLAFNLVPLAIVLLGLLWLGPLGAFALLVAVLLARTGLQVAQPWVGLRFASAAGLAGLLLVYPIWGLMRLTAAHRFLQRGTRELNAVLAGLPKPEDGRADGDFLDRDFDASRLAARRLRDLHRFVRDGIDHLPDATLVLNRRGKVFIANRAAARHWGQDAAALGGMDGHTLLRDIRSRSNGMPMLTPDTLRQDRPVPVTGEGEDAHGRILLLRCMPTFNADNIHSGWMVALVDITRMRRAQSQRDEALRFISHDIREPSASILTVVDLARAQPGVLPRELLLQRIEQHARTGLELADGFVNLARAEGQPFKAELLDLNDLLLQSIDNAWGESRRREVRITLARGPDEAMCVGDRGLLARALTNILSNALKYSPRGAEIECAVADRGAQWAVSVRDSGPGIAVEQQSRLFEPFHRLHRESHPEVHGIGLGLLLVRTVAQRHHGSVEIDSAEGAGCTVILQLPKPMASPMMPTPAPHEQPA